MRVSAGKRLVIIIVRWLQRSVLKIPIYEINACLRFDKAPENHFVQHNKQRYMQKSTAQWLSFEWSHVRTLSTD